MSKQSLKRGFTLLEVLFAALAFTVVVGALYSVLHGALRLRESASAPFIEGIPRHYARAVLERDLSNILIGSGIMAGPVLSEKLEETGVRRDRLEIYTASGSLNSIDPWGEMQKVEYTLLETERLEETQGYDLTRVVTRNLLAEVEEEPELERLLPGVQSLTFAFFDGEEWQESWDSTATEGGDETVEEPVLLAVRVSVGFAPSLESARVSPPLELVVPIVAQAPASESEEEEAEAGGEETGGGALDGGSQAGGGGGKDSGTLSDSGGGEGR